MRRAKNVLEWTVFAASLALVAAVLTALLIDAVRSGEAPPDLVVRLGAARRAGGTFHGPIAVHNRGDATAEGVGVEVVLAVGGREVERAEVNFAHVPRHSSRRGWVAFRHDPACCELVARPVGFQAP